MRILVILVVTVLFLFFLKIIVDSCINTAASTKNVIVPGMALENGELTDDLLFRLDTAVKYLEENPESLAILTGGNPNEAGRTEAAVMYDILIDRGIAEGRMILENQAESTKANYINTAQIINPEDPVVLISSNYHMDRAVQTANTFGSNVMHEVIMELNELTLKQ